MNEGLNLWNRAKKVIPGGNGLLSKRPERYVPDLWPTYYSRAKGIHIWDLDGKEYVDMAQMGIGAAILGYADDDVNSAVISAISAGVSTTLNAPEEVYLAEELLKCNPFAGGVRFARTGGEAMSIAVRLARAYTKKDAVVISGYHGWCDWYLAANLTGDGLGGHLLPGLNPKGVPKGLAGSTIPVLYNDVDTLYKAVKDNNVGVIVFEGARYDFPTSDFINAIADISKKYGVVTVVDEITSGWRMCNGGVHTIYGFTPDVAVYGKAMGNGYAISAIIGRQEVMDQAQETFVSSTFWTERVGFTAALATIKKMISHKVPEHLITVGSSIGSVWSRLSEKYAIELDVTDFKPLVTFKLKYGDLNNALYTLFSQEMLRRGYLAASSVYVSFLHTEDDVQKYTIAFDEVFAIMARAIQKGNVESLLNSRIREDGFKRLN